MLGPLNKQDQIVIKNEVRRISLREKQLSIISVLCKIIEFCGTDDV